MNVTLFEKRVFAFTLAFNLMASVIRHRREGRVKVGTKIGVIQPQAKEHLKLPEA